MEPSHEISSFNDFEILKMIGEGSFGKVYKVKRNDSAEILAMKIIDISKMDKKSLQQTLNEIRILCSI